VTGKLYHLGFRGRVARANLADANELRDWRIFADFAHIRIGIARPLYAHDPIGVELAQSLYALDSTTINLCLTLFPWAKFQKQKGAVKMHTLLDLRGSIPTFIRISDGKLHDVNVLDEICFEVARSMFSIGATSISSACTGSRSALRSSSYAPNGTCCSSADTLGRWTRARGCAPTR
jgi:hypothetical protein